MSIHRLIAILVLALLPEIAFATTWRWISLAEAVDRAEIVVVGTTAGEKPDSPDRLIVKTVLRGTVRPGERIDFDGWLKLDSPPPVGREGVFLLVKGQNQRFRPLNPICIQTKDVAASQANVERVVAMLDDPAAALDQQVNGPDADLAYTLGRHLNPVKITGEGKLAAVIPHTISITDNLIPYGVSGRFEIRVNPTPGQLKPFSVTVTGDDPLATLLAERLSQFQLDPDKPDSATLEIKNPDRVAGRPASEVRQYVRNALRQSKPGMRRTALLAALAAARDVEAVPDVVALLDYTSPSSEAAQWLRFSASPSIVEPLRRYVEGYADLDQFNSAVLEAIHALAEVGGTDALPTLRPFAARGWAYAASELGRSGDASDLKLLLEAGNRKPTDHAFVLDALRHLVERSNRPVQPFMSSSMIDGEVAARMQLQWNDWWKENREGFVVEQKR